MDKIICKICNEELVDYKSLHRHLKKHKIKMEDYYFTHYPRKDKLTGDFIDFINRDHYLTSDFNSKENLKKWFSIKSKDECISYIKDYLVRRKNNKNLKYVLTQVECRSLVFPSVLTIKKFLDYDKLNSEIGLLDRFPKFVYNHKKTVNQVIWVDSREQSPFGFKNIDTAITGLNYGDYMLNHSCVSPHCVIERKSAADFISTLSEGLDRFENEIQRAETDKAYIVVLVEDTLSNLLDFKNKNLCHKKCKITPEYLFHNVRYLLQKYNNIQFLFSANRFEASNIAQKLLTKQNMHDQDLQLLYDKGELI